MITVAVANVAESSQQALQFIYETSKRQGLKVCCIAPQSSVMYDHNRRVPLKAYVEQLKSESKCDLLIVDFTQDAMKKQLYEHIDFTIAVLCDSQTKRKKNKTKRIHVSQHLLQAIKSTYYILPEKYKEKTAQAITYGWSQDAHISATSAQATADGQMEMQCCIGQTLCALNGTQIPLKEFGVSSDLQSVEGLLAGIATLVLYGIDLGEE